MRAVVCRDYSRQSAKLNISRTQLAFTARRYANAVYAVVVCLTVTRQYCIKTAKHRITQKRRIYNDRLGNL